MSTFGPPSIWHNPRTFLLAFLSPLILIAVPATAFFLYTRLKPRRARSAIVLVLGDFGRSPRMMYHALSLVQHGYETYVVAYGDTPPISALLDASINRAADLGKAGDGNANAGSAQHVHTSEVTDQQRSNDSAFRGQNGKCHFHYLSSLKTILSLPLPWPIRAAIRLAHQCIAVLWIIWVTVSVHTEYIIVQTPPAIPTLFLVQVAAMISGSKVVVDWHNTGWSVLKQRVGSGVVMRLARAIETITGQNAYAHLFVSNAMKLDLAASFELQGKQEVLHDRPPGWFRRTTPSERVDLFTRLELDLPSIFDIPSSRLIISSTSWTADEDFTPLLFALDAYEAAASSETLPPLLVLITGKGPLRSTFEHLLSQRHLRHVAVKCLFVPATDYPTLLGCADLGLSFHDSTSGTDLPMKIVDMLGCETPVLALGYGTLVELVQDGREGRWWNTKEELRDLILEHMRDPSKIDALRANIQDMKRWEENWDEVVYQRLLS